MTTLLTKISIYMTLIAIPNANPADFTDYLMNDEITMETCDGIATENTTLDDCKKLVAIEEIR